MVKIFSLKFEKINKTTILNYKTALVKGRLYFINEIHKIFSKHSQNHFTRTRNQYKLQIQYKKLSLIAPTAHDFRHKSQH